MPDSLLKWSDPTRCADGAVRASVPLVQLETLWFNTGTLCNIACENCYIESTPRNDRLVYLSLADVRGFLDEIARDNWPVREIGLTGGEPFMNPEILPILDAACARGHRVLVLTNAMRPLMRPRVMAGMRDLAARYPGRITLRISLDHWSADKHDLERGAGAFAQALEGMRWLAQQDFALHVAGRSLWNETQAEARAGYGALFAREGFAIDAQNPAQVMIFPEMNERAEVPEITTECWDILGKTPDEVMCASARMVVRRKGAFAPVVLACTLLAYDPRFEMGATLAEAAGPVALAHPHCAKFCVLGGASCSG